MNKKELSERDICTKFITPALRQAGWDELTQLREEVSFTKGRVIVRGRMVKRGKAERADYILYYKPNIPLPPANQVERLDVFNQRPNAKSRSKFLANGRGVIWRK